MIHAEWLREMVAKDAWLMDVLRAVRSLGIPDWVVGSGVVRNLVWDELHGYPERTPPNDVDVAYFDPDDVSRARDATLEQRLERALPGVPWEVTNQAGVHLWYEEKFGVPIRPLTSIADALAHWPETATSVGIRLESDDAIEIVAPCGLDDLFGLILRRNATQVSRAFFLERAASKRVRERWPKVTVIEE